MSEPFPFDPDRTEERGEFPDHSDEPQPRLTGAEARTRARAALLLWRSMHGD